nr:c-type cytochrome [Enterovirga sp. DB1703]
MLFLAGPAAAEFRGHGGPVRALAILEDGAAAVSGSFDQSAILWDLRSGEARSVLRFHEGAVNAVLALPGGRFATAGEDGRIALWQPGGGQPLQVEEAHKGPIVGLALSPDGGRIASASWDGTARLTPLSGGPARVFEGHQGQVNAVAFMPDGRLVTAGYDATLRIWPAGEGAPAIRTLPTPLNALAVGPGGEIVAGGADGVLRLLSTEDQALTELDLQTGPILAISVAPGGGRAAVALLRGAVALVDLGTASTAARLVGPGLPVWSLAFSQDGAEILTGGSDRLVRRWNARTGEHIGPVVMMRPPELNAVAGSERGAEVFKACAACHTLTPDGGNRAGPTLHGVFGRRVASLPGYNFSPALKQLDIVWNAETISKLFEIGPARYTPGTKMPEQTVTAEDREALVRYLEKATR